MSQPRLQSRREYWVYPPEATETRRIEIAIKAAKASVTCGPSYDDAGIGDLQQKTAVLFDIPTHRHQEFRDWYELHYKGTIVEFRNTPPTNPGPDPDLTGLCRLGLHATAHGGAYSAADLQQFADLQPDIIKISSNHHPDSIRQLAQQHPGVTWILRIHYSTGGRAVTPTQFVSETINDLPRILAILDGYSLDILIEIHNEPNLVSEGLYMAMPGVVSRETPGWCSGHQFNTWFLKTLQLLRQALPGRKFLFPGLSPGPTVQGVRQNHMNFALLSYQAIQAADALGVHTYWAGDDLAKAMSVVDWFRNQFPAKLIYITEASNNQPWGTPDKALQYADFWKQLNHPDRDHVRGITYFVVSGEYPHETWVDRDMARQVRQHVAGRPH